MYELLCILSKYYAYYTLSNRVLVVDTRVCIRGDTLEYECDS